MLKAIIQPGRELREDVDQFSLMQRAFYIYGRNIKVCLHAEFLHRWHDPDSLEFVLLAD